MEARIRKLEKDIDQLKKAYERYFSGVERLAPEKLAASVAREVRSFTGTVISNTALRFRVQQAIARYQTYLAYWQKTMKELEEGKKPRRRLGEKPAATAPEGEDTLEMTDAGAGKGKIEGFYAALTREYERAGMKKVPGMDRVQVALEDQMKVIREKFACEKVVFKVVSEDGKVRIKASPSRRSKG
ncbi:MAG: hypothetical protein JXR72_02820 [Proteobacteria bacterium]|nr:hypothetical protein [Pseudomonadota bacterium]